MKKERLNEMIGILFFALSLFLFWSLYQHSPADYAFYTSHPNGAVQNGAGIIGATIARFLVLIFGISAFTFSLIFIFWAASFLFQRIPEKLFYKVIGFIIFQSSTAALFSLVSPESNEFAMGGIWGYFLSANLKIYFGFVGGLIISLACFCLSFILATEYLIFPFLSRGFTSLVDFILAMFENMQTHIKRRKKAPAFTSKKRNPKKKVIENKKTVMKESEVPEQPDGDEDEQDEKERKKEELFKNIPGLKVKKYDPQAVMDAQANLEKIEKELRERQKQNSADTTSRLSKKVQEQDADKPVVAVFSESASTDQSLEGFVFPSLDLLRKPETVQIEDDLAENSRVLENCLKDFDIDVKVTEVEQGPVITRYELLPAPGIKLSRITGLQDDIALSLKAKSIRIIAPIPGKAAVGIEVPNSNTNTVFLSELLATLMHSSKKKKIQLPLVFGKEISGKPLIADLASMPHLLIAGSTGSGKTVCINALIISLMYFLNPEQLKFIMIDPKRVELAQYNDIPYLLSPVVTDAVKASATLNWVVTEMENRYKLFAEVGVRNIQTYNSRPIETPDEETAQTEEETTDVEDEVIEDPEMDDDIDEGEEVDEDETDAGEDIDDDEDEEDDEETEEDAQSEKYPRSLPYIIVIIDELADLMMIAADKVETAIARLAQLARATGIHLILATQRPSVDVITGIIKANFPARVSFKVSSKTDSRTVLDSNGADKLLGKGDMLFLEPGRDKPIRAQGTLITDEEMNKVVAFVKRHGKVVYNKAVQEASSAPKGSVDMEKDELYDEAVRVILETRQASVSILQRRLRLGYNRAGRMIDMMEAEGLVGPHQGSKPREILVGQDENY